MRVRGEGGVEGVVRVRGGGGWTRVRGCESEGWTRVRGFEGEGWGG